VRPAIPLCRESGSARRPRRLPLGRRRPLVTGPPTPGSGHGGMIRDGLVVVAVLLALVGCGSDDEPTATPDATGTAKTTRTTTSASTPAPEPPPKRARSVRSCAKLWNADALPPGSSQVTANEFVAKLAPVRVHVAYQRGDCFVVWPIGGRRIAYSVAADGRRPFSNPDQRRLNPPSASRTTAAPTARDAWR